MQSRVFAALLAATGLPAAAQAELTVYECVYEFQCQDVEKCGRTNWTEALAYDSERNMSYTRDPMTGKWLRINQIIGEHSHSFVSMGDDGLRWVVSINASLEALRSDHKVSPSLQLFDPEQHFGKCTKTVR